MKNKFEYSKELLNYLIDHGKNIKLRGEYEITTLMIGCYFLDEN